jgi:hypothetical protein
VVGAGWARIGPDARIAAWARAALPLARAAIAVDADGWRCGGTWHVGLDALPNGPDGGVGVAFPWAALPLDPVPLHQGQVSTIRPGYPQPWEGEGDAAFAYRVKRDAAHLDGLLALGPDKRRFVKEPHAWVLGIALNDHAADCSPLVVWEGSHMIMQAAMARAFAGHAPDSWPDIDVTDAYTAARREVFASCRRIALPIRVGEATLIHRHLLHGMAAWGGGKAPPEGRMIAYFRPMLPSVADWMGQVSAVAG